jgi:hypothetical protein
MDMGVVACDEKPQSSYSCASQGSAGGGNALAFPEAFDEGFGEALGVGTKPAGTPSAALTAAFRAAMDSLGTGL